MIDEAYTDAERLVGENWEKVVAVAEALLKYETLTGSDIEHLMKGEAMDKPTVADLLQQETAKTAPPAMETPKEDPGDEMTWLLTVSTVRPSGKVNSSSVIKGVAQSAPSCPSGEVF